jgi:hypothetical protein
VGILLLFSTSKAIKPYLGSKAQIKVFLLKLGKKKKKTESCFGVSFLKRGFEKNIKETERVQVFTEFLLNYKRK